MTRPDLQSPPVTRHAADKMTAFHADFVETVRKAIAEHDIVVVGMAWNQAVARARRRLDAEGLTYHYIEEGNYLWGWKRRLAVKLWSGWPTFPQVFVKGVLVGGGSDLAAQLADGTIAGILKDGAAAA